MSEITIYGKTADSWMDIGDPVYATAHDAAVADEIYPTNDSLVVGQEAWGYYYVYRSYIYFDIPAIDGVIISAKLVFRGDNKNISGGGRNFDVVVQNGQPTYPHNPLIVADFNKDYYSDDGGSINTTDITDGVDFEINLNETGLGWITTEQQLKLCLRSSYDINNSAPPYPPSSTELVGFRSANYAVGAQRPRLVLTYQVPLSGNPGYFPFGANPVKGGGGYLPFDMAALKQHWGYLLFSPQAQAQARRYLAIGHGDIVLDDARYLQIGANPVPDGRVYMPWAITCVPRIPKPSHGAWFQRLSSVKKTVS